MPGGSVNGYDYRLSVTAGLLLALSTIVDYSSCYQRPRDGYNTFSDTSTVLPVGSSALNVIMTPKWTEPYFDVSVPKNVTAMVGKSAYLSCRVRNLGNKTVSWIRHRDLHILTVATYTYTNDQRFLTTYHRDVSEWTMQIKWAQRRDAGMYECQVSTQPVKSYSVRLNVVESAAGQQQQLDQQQILEHDHPLNHAYNDGRLGDDGAGGFGDGGGFDGGFGRELVASGEPHRSVYPPQQQQQQQERQQFAADSDGWLGLRSSEFGRSPTPPPPPPSLAPANWYDQQQSDGSGGDNNNNWLPRTRQSLNRAPAAKILGGPDLYVDKGSTINLTCVIRFSPEPPAYIFWYHLNEVISYDSARITMESAKGEPSVAYLLIRNADLADTGKYSCSPSNADVSSIRVHVLNGERPEAMQTGASTAIHRRAASASHLQLLSLAFLISAIMGDWAGDSIGHLAAQKLGPAKWSASLAWRRRSSAPSPVATTSTATTTNWHRGFAALSADGCRSTWAMSKTAELQCVGGR